MTNDTWFQWLLDLLPGLGVSLQLTAALLAIGLPLGLLLALGLTRKGKIVRGLTLGVVEFARGLPALILLYLVYFGLPQLHMTLSAFLSAAVALGFSFAGYVSDVFRSGLESVPVGQREAASALGLTPATGFFRVILPQAVRIVVPPLLGWSISYFQATSLAFAIAVPELMSRAYVLATTNFEYLGVLSLAAVLYAVISIPLSYLVEHLSYGQKRRFTPTMTIPELSTKV
jgi:polar amino acid transport system permease protein